MPKFKYFSFSFNLMFMLSPVVGPLVRGALSCLEPLISRGPCYQEAIVLRASAFFFCIVCLWFLLPIL